MAWSVGVGVAVKVWTGRNARLMSATVCENPFPRKRHRPSLVLPHGRLTVGPARNAQELRPIPLPE